MEKGLGLGKFHKSGAIFGGTPVWEKAPLLKEFFKRGGGLFPKICGGAPPRGLKKGVVENPPRGGEFGAF